MYGEDQKAIFTERRATEAKNHDMLVPVDALTEAELSQVLALESWGAAPKRRGETLVVPCFFRAAVADILARPHAKEASAMNGEPTEAEKRAMVDGLFQRHPRTRRERAMEGLADRLDATTAEQEPPQE